jgi:hypothetical protein
LSASAGATPSALALRERRHAPPQLVGGRSSTCVEIVQTRSRTSSTLVAHGTSTLMRLPGLGVKFGIPLWADSAQVA